MTDAAVKTAVDAIRHYWQLIVGLTLVGIIGAVVLVVATPPTYEAQAVLYVDPGAQPAALQASDGLLSRYYVDQATSQRVLDRARLKLGSNGSHVSDTTVRATALRGTNTIGVFAQAREPQLAADIANAVAEAVRDQNRDDAASRSQASIDYLNTELMKLSRAIATETREPVLSALNAQYLTTYTNLENTMLTRTREMGAISVIQPAQAPTRPISPSRTTYLLVGSLTGLIVGALAALLLARFDDRLRDIRELGAATGVPVVVPVRAASSAGKGDSRNGGYDLAMAQLVARHPTARAIMIAAVSPHDSAAEVAAELGCAAERSGRRVLVVVPSQAGIGTSQSNGSCPRLATVAADSQADIERAIHGDRYEICLLAVPPPTEGPAALGLARKVDATILVATRLKTRFSEVRREAEELNAAGGTLVAAIFLVK